MNDIALTSEWIAYGTDILVRGSELHVAYTGESDCSQAQAVARALHLVALHNATLGAKS